MISPTSSGEIHLLPEHIVDQIKAGEVIERPATLLKELIENSIDASSTKISIHIINNGLDLISVEDNGKGISFDDLPLAFCRHATSKINLFEDLYRLNSYGFRGEALASMASVSKLTCNSNQQNKLESSIQFQGGEMISHRQDDKKLTSSGTRIFVKDLFYNTPVRMKFLQSQTSERNQLKKIINAFILTHPEIEFSIKWDDSPKEFYPIIDNSELGGRVKSIFEKKKESLDFIEFENEYDGVKVKIFLTHNYSKGNTGKFHYLFINDRYVQDTKIHKIILNSAQPLWPFGLSGSYVVFVEILPDQLDVNVHPNKTVVKLFQPSKVYSLLSSSIKKHLPQSFSQSNNDQGNYQFNIDNKDIDFKGINYGEKDFTQSQTLDTYFENLDQNLSSTTVDHKQWNFVLKTNDALIAYKEQNYYLFDNQNLLKIFIEDLFSKTSDFNPVPLLVSVPIESKQRVNNELLIKLNNFGFELDYLSDETLILRSFPKCLSDLPYGEIAKQFIMNKDFLLTDPFDFQATSSLTEKIIHRIGLPQLIENKAVKKLDPKELLKLI